MFEIELFLTFELWIYVKPNCLKFNCFNNELCVNKKRTVLILTELIEYFIKITSFGVKWPGKGWYAVKQNNQLTNQCAKTSFVFFLKSNLPAFRNHIYIYIYIIYIYIYKQNLALNSIQKFIYHKIQKQIIIFWF